MTPSDSINVNENTKTFPYIVLLSSAIIHQIFGAMAFPVSKFGLGFIEPFTFAFYRFVLSTLILLIIVKLRKKGKPVEKKDYLKIAGIGFLIIPFNQTMYLWGQSLTAANHGSILFATAPIWTMIGASIHLNEKVSFRRALGIIAAVGGVLYIMTTGALDFGTEYLMGDIIILIAVIAWVYYTIFGRDLVRKYGAFRVTAYAFLSGTLLYFPFGIYKAISFNYSAVPVGAWWSVIYMAVGMSVIAYVIWYWLLKYYDASRIAVYQNLQPLLATVVAFVWLGEPIGWAFIIGGLVVLSGVIIAEV